MKKRHINSVSESSENKHTPVRRCVQNTLARCFGMPKGSAVKLLVIGMLLGMFYSPAETYVCLAQKTDIARSLPEPKDPAVRDRERKALIEFYEALGGHDWILRDFWGSDRPVGEWHGVTTDADGYVVQLTIYDNNLTGPVSAAICRLERLHTLHLSLTFNQAHSWCEHQS